MDIHLPIQVMDTVMVTPAMEWALTGTNRSRRLSGSPCVIARVSQRSLPYGLARSSQVAFYVEFSDSSSEVKGARMVCR